MPSPATSLILRIQSLRDSMIGVSAGTNSAAIVSEMVFDTDAHTSPRPKASFIDVARLATMAAVSRNPSGPIAATMAPLAASPRISAWIRTGISSLMIVGRY